MIQTDKAAIQRENILRTAYGLFKVHGYAGTTTREIAVAAGINKGSSIRFFASRDSSLRVSLITDLLDQISCGAYEQAGP